MRKAEAAQEVAYVVTAANPVSGSRAGTEVSKILRVLDSGFRRNDVEKLLPEIPLPSE